MKSQECMKEELGVQGCICLKVCTLDISCASCLAAVAIDLYVNDCLGRNSNEVNCLWCKNLSSNLCECKIVQIEIILPDTAKTEANTKSPPFT